MTDRYTPRKHLEGTYSELRDRRDAVRTLLQANRKQPNNVTTYLKGYYDALDLVTDEVKQAKDAEIMGTIPCDCEKEND